MAVKHFGNGVLLLPIDDPWQMLEAGLQAFGPGFVLSRDQPEQQRRDAIDPWPANLSRCLACMCRTGCPLFLKQNRSSVESLRRSTQKLLPQLPTNAEHTL